MSVSRLSASFLERIEDKVGGLADTVTNATLGNLANGTATGFVIDALGKDAVVEAVRRAAILFRHKLAWQKLMKSGMTRDFGWQHSAQQYLGVYQKICLS